MSIDFNQLRELLGALAHTDVTELTLKSQEFELTIRKGNSSLGVVTLPNVAPHPVVVPEKTVSAPKMEISAGPPTETQVPPPIEPKWVAITSPMVGTFYRASAPDEAPFVETGDRIRTGQTVCIIEAMKLMNEIEAEVAGQVMEIAVDNGEPVEYGQTLMWINPG